MINQPNFFAIIPASVRYDARLKPNAKLLYGEITALCNREGFCWADNRYFSELYDVNHKTISRWISQLEELNYLLIEHFPLEGNKRKIFIENSSVNLVIKKSLPSDKKITTLVTKKSLPSDKKVTPLYENNTINNTMNRESTALAFFEQNYPYEFEVLMMQFKKQINDFDGFAKMFEATVEQEDLSYDLHVLSGRFKKYAFSWIKNQVKFEGKVVEMLANGPAKKINSL
jgi:hypothetical protein